MALQEAPLLDEDVPACALLAAAVVRQAFHDLHYQPADRSGEALRIRKDAKDFLVRRLWEPDCLWYELVGHILVHPHVIAEVERQGKRR